MAKKSTRGKIRDRIDYSELLLDIKTNNTEIHAEKEIPEDIKDNSCDEKYKNFLRMLSDKRLCTFIKYFKTLYTKSIVSF